jgi:predicted amidohydrolase
VTGRIRVAVLQGTGLVNSPQENLNRIASRAQEARAQGADLLVTPELFVSGYAPSLVHTTDGVAQRRQLADIAVASGLAIVGSTVEHDRDRRYISASFFDRDGAELTRYRKQHLFGAAEKGAFDAGEAAPAVVPFNGVNVALGICFDIEFPEFVRAAAVAGTELLCVPTAVPLRAGGQSDAHLFDTRLIPAMVVPTRALESQLFIAYANHAGPHFAGLSTVADPYGRRLAAAGDDEELIVADIAVATVRQARLDTDYLATFVHSAASAHPQ